jgi:hypothetical protein
MLEGKRIFLEESEKSYFRKDHLEVEWPSLVYATNQNYPVSMVKIERAVTCRHASEALRYLTSRGHTNLRNYKSRMSKAVDFQYKDVDSAGMNTITEDRLLETQIFHGMRFRLHNGSGISWDLK